MQSDRRYPGEFHANIFELYRERRGELPFRAIRAGWRSGWVVVVRVEEQEGTNYGKAWGQYMMNGKLGRVSRISCDGCYQWEHFRGKMAP